MKEASRPANRYFGLVERLPYIAVLAAYALASVWHLLSLRKSASMARIRAVLAVGVAVHLGTLVLGAVISAAGPGLSEALSATSLGIGVAYLAVAQGRSRTLGVFLAPLATVLLGVALAIPGNPQVQALQETGYSPWLPIHLGLVFAGIGGFALSSIVGAVYLWVRARLKKKRFGGLRQLPSLETLDRIQFRAMLFGFVFLTLGIAAGGAWAAASLQGGWTFDPKVGFTVMIWLWYGVALQVRLVLGRRGRWTALFSIVGFAGLIFSLIGLNFLLSGWHGYG